MSQLHSKLQTTGFPGPAQYVRMQISSGESLPFSLGSRRLAVSESAVQKCGRMPLQKTIELF